MNELRIYICGRLAIEWPGGVLLESDFPARQGRLMWAALVVGRRRPVDRGALADAIWGDEIPDGWDTTLNALASRLRTMLRPVTATIPELTIRGDVGRYELVLPRDVFIDLERARAGLHAAETALDREQIDLALSEARVAMEIAARGFLDGEHAPWIVGQRRSLADLQIHAMECTLQGELKRGNYRRAEREAEELNAIDPLNETAYRVRMQASAALGNRSGIVRAMDACRTELRTQAGLNPSTKTERLFEQLTRG
jgi:DNA-binding SARP family transcriptional activator